MSKCCDDPKHDGHKEKADKPVYNDEQKELIKVATLLQKKGLKEKEAVVNRQRVYYFRADAFHELVLANKDEILKILSKHIKLDKIDSVDDSLQIGDIMINNGLMKCYDRLKDDVQKFKYPKKLMEAEASMHAKGFYAFQIHKSQTKMTVLAIILALSIVAIILFPLWPYSVKYAIFNILFYFSAGMLLMIAFRLILWIFLFPLGIDVWIFPNLFDDDAGLLESFLPILLINRREDDWLIFALRILMVILFSAYWYKESGLPIPIEGTIETFNEIFEWGKDKMVGNETSSLQHTGQGYQSIDDIIRMTEEYERADQEENERKAEEEREKKEQEYKDEDEANEDL